MSSSSSLSELVEALRRASPTDLEGETALWQLRQSGPEAIDVALPLLTELKDPEMRDALAEGLTMIFDDWQDAARAATLAAELAKIFSAASERSERELYAGLLADLRCEASVPAMIAAARHPRIHQEEYETLRDAIERLNATCPELYFDEKGQAWEVDGDGIVHCMFCGKAAEPTLEGVLQHVDGVTCADVGTPE